MNTTYTQWCNITAPGEYEAHMRNRELIPEWDTLSKSQKKKRKKEVRSIYGMNSLDCCQPTVQWSQVAPCWNVPCVQEEKRNDMYNNASATIAVSAVKDDALDYILRRMKEIYSEKLEAARKAFDFYGFKPESIKQAKQWLKDGFYRIDQPKYIDEELEDSAYCWREFFSWGDKPVDMKAYEAAEGKLKAAYQSARDVVQVLSDETIRLQNLKDFEAYAIA